MDNFKPNWLAIWAVILVLVTIGWLLGALASSPDGRSIDCPSASLIRVMQKPDGGVVAYCEE